MLRLTSNPDFEKSLSAYLRGRMGQKGGQRNEGQRKQVEILDGLKQWKGAVKEKSSKRGG